MGSALALRYRLGRSYRTIDRARDGFDYRLEELFTLAPSSGKFPRMRKLSGTSSSFMMMALVKGRAWLQREGASDGKEAKHCE